MIDRRFLVSGLIACGLPAAMLPIAFRSKFFAAALAALDSNNDGVIDLIEVKYAANTLLDSRNKESDATHDRKEIGGRAGKTQLKQADPDHDGTLTKDEYLGLVEKLFYAADANEDGTVTAKELNSKAGRALLRLIQP